MAARVQPSGGERREREGAGERARGEREAGRVVALLIHRGSAAVTSWCVRDTGLELGRYSDELQLEDDGTFAGNPLVHFSFFCFYFFEMNNSLFYSIEASDHFQKL